MKKRLGEKIEEAVAAASGGLSDCVIGKGSRFEGDARCAGLLRIEGECSGTISVLGTLVVAAGATVEAKIEADDIIIAGFVSGSIAARRSLSLESTARVRADVRSKSFKLDDGARYKGSVSRIVEP